MERLTERIGNSVIYSKFNSNNSDGCYEMMNNCLHKLAEYEDSEEQCLLLRLPCKVGDTLYLPYSRPRYIKEVMVTDFMFNGCDLHILTDFVKLGNRDIGKNVFLTKEEAEQALQQIGE